MFVPHVLMATIIISLTNLVIKTVPLTYMLIHSIINVSKFVPMDTMQIINYYHVLNVIQLVEHVLMVPTNIVPHVMLICLLLSSLHLSLKQKLNLDYLYILMNSVVLTNMLYQDGLDGNNHQDLHLLGVLSLD